MLREWGRRVRRHRGSDRASTCEEYAILDAPWGVQATSSSSIILEFCDALDLQPDIGSASRAMEPSLSAQVDGTSARSERGRALTGFFVVKAKPSHSPRDG